MQIEPAKAYFARQYKYKKPLFSQLLRKKRGFLII